MQIGSSTANTHLSATSVAPTYTVSSMPSLSPFKTRPANRKP